jgi:hypothetical protein
MVITGTRVLGEMCFVLDEGCRSYTVEPEDKRMMNLIVATDKLRVTSKRVYHEFTKSVDIKKAFITGHDVAAALVECERVIRAKKGADPDHSFFEGFLCRTGDEEVICYGWGS